MSDATFGPQIERERSKGPVTRANGRSDGPVALSGPESATEAGATVRNPSRERRDGGRYEVGDRVAFDRGAVGPVYGTVIEVPLGAVRWVEDLERHVCCHPASDRRLRVVSRAAA